MHKYRGVFRFMADTQDDLADAARTLDILLNRKFPKDSIQAERDRGGTSFLVVLPTGTGKTEILIADYAREYKAGRAARALVMVPTRQLREDHAQNFQNRLPDHGPPAVPQDAVTIQTYAWMSRHYTRFDSLAFDYIAVDEAHHSVAPTVQKVIQSSIIKKSEGQLIVSELCEKIRAGLN